jgi:manganese/zinc/iron transport system permease protein
MTALFSQTFFLVLLGAVLFGASAASVGAFAYMRKRSLLGDALAHASLPGITVSFALTGSRSIGVLLCGAFISCFFAYAFLEWVSRNSKLKTDSILAITLSFFFALGVFHLSFLQHSSSAQQAGLDKLLFGQASAILPRDILLLIALSLCIGVSLSSLYHRLLLTSFDKVYARTLGIHVQPYDIIFLALSILAIVLGLQLVGVVLMSAMLITPAAAARMWTHSNSRFIVLCASFGILSSILGVSISAIFPKMPTGPWIVLSASIIFFLSSFLGSAQGLLWTFLHDRRLTNKEEQENVIRSLFLLEEKNVNACIHAEDILRYRKLSRSRLAHILRHLHKSQFLTLTSDEHISLSEKGKVLGEQLTRRHRLVETYLAEKAGFPTDRVHDFAEKAEHVLTEGLEQEVNAQIASPSKDPHGKEIPK